MKTLIAFLCLFFHGALHALAADDAVAKEWKLLQGEWTLIESQCEGKTLRGRDLIKEGGELPKIVIKGRLVNGERAWNLDPSKKPKAIDFKVTAAEDKLPITPRNVESLPGIYRIDDDKLVICFDLAGTMRPTRFESSVRKTFIVFVFERVKKSEKPPN